MLDPYQPRRFQPLQFRATLLYRSSVKPPTAKKIFLFLDGTGNEFIANPDKEKGNSNVVKLYTTLRVADNQVAYYHPGVGTMGDPTIRHRLPVSGP